MFLTPKTYENLKYRIEFGWIFLPVVVDKTWIPYKLMLYLTLESREDFHRGFFHTSPSSRVSCTIFLRISDAICFCMQRAALDKQAKHRTGLLLFF